jgi:uncharacterized protein
MAGLTFNVRLNPMRMSWAAATTKRPANSSVISLLGKASTAFGSVIPSYKPGVHLTDLATSLPGYAIEAIREAIPAFERQIKGFFHARCRADWC